MFFRQGLSGPAIDVGVNWHPKMSDLIKNGTIDFFKPFVYKDQDIEPRYIKNQKILIKALIFLKNKTKNAKFQIFLGSFIGSLKACIG